MSLASLGRPCFYIIYGLILSWMQPSKLMVVRDEIDSMIFEYGFV